MQYFLCCYSTLLILLPWSVYVLHKAVCSLPIGYTCGVTFHQPQSLTAQLDQTVEIECSHDDKNLDVMLWYIQNNNSTAMVLIGYIYGSLPPTYEDDFKPPNSRFKMERKSDVSALLSISNVNLQDSAVYFCAARELTVLKVKGRTLLKP